MIAQGKNNISGFYHGTTEIIKVYRGKTLIWEKGGSSEASGSTSCFGNGYWINDYPWLNDDAWKNQSNN